MKKMNLQLSPYDIEDQLYVSQFIIIIIIIIILFVQKPKMKQCKLKTWTLNKTHQAQTSSYGGL